MMTWTFDKRHAGSHVIATVTAENVEMAKIWLSRRLPGIPVENVDLVPLVTHSRHVRVLLELDL